MIVLAHHVTVVRCIQNWAPLGAARFKELIDANFFKANRFFRVIDGFMAQFGIHANPKIAAEWKTKTMEDDPIKEKNSRGMVSFATSGKNSRTTQMFINFKDNHNLDGMGFSPFARISSGMDVVVCHGPRPFALARRRDPGVEGVGQPPLHRLPRGISVTGTSIE